MARVTHAHVDTSILQPAGSTLASAPGAATLPRSRSLPCAVRKLTRSACCLRSVRGPTRVSRCRYNGWSASPRCTRRRAFCARAAPRQIDWPPGGPYARPVRGAHMGGPVRTRNRHPGYPLLAPRRPTGPRVGSPTCRRADVDLWSALAVPFAAAGRFSHQGRGLHTP